MAAGLLVHHLPDADGRIEVTVTAVDLDQLLGRLRDAATRARTPAPPLRDVRCLPAHSSARTTIRPVPQSVAGFAVDAWTDGIQSRHVVCWLHHRPVIVQHAAAIAVDAQGDLFDRLSRVEVVCSKADADWVGAVTDEKWLHVVDDGASSAIATAAGVRLQEVRWSIERSLSARVLDTVDGTVVVDGPLTGHPLSPRLMGVVKSHRAAYLEPERHLHELGEGEMTWPAFEILDPAAKTGTGRHSCYLRLHDHTWQHETHGLVRLEAADRSLLPPLAALCMSARQFDPGADSRYDVHLAPIAWAERIGRAGAPRWS